MKKLSLLLSVLLLVVGVCSCGPKVEEIKLNNTSIELKIDDTVKLKTTISPEEAKDVTVSWKSSDEKIAKVSEDGTVTAIGEGSAEITATAKNVTAVCKVKVSKEITETDYTTIEGLYVDESYEDDDESLTLLYVFKTVKTPKENLSVSSVYNDITFDDTNSYESEHLPDANEYMNSYHYSSYIEEVYSGKPLKLLETYKVPKGELTSSKYITFADDAIPETDKLCVLTENIKSCANPMEIAKSADPEGYRKEKDLMKKADSGKTSKVKNDINGYEWSFYVNSIIYKLSFSAPDTFTLTTSFGSNSGKYVVRKGYISCTYTSGSKATINIPYSYEDGEIKLETADAFDVKG